MLKKYIIALAVLATSQAVTALEITSKALDFKGVSLGASPEETRSTFMASMTSWQCARGVDTGATGYCSAEGITFAQSHTRSVEFGYVDGRLSILTAFLDASAFPAAVAALRTKYGAPSQTKQGTVANLNGARLPQIQHTWTVLKSGVVTAILRGSTMDTAEITYRSVEQAALDNAKQRTAKPDI
jgi:hypothetical protein